VMGAVVVLGGVALAETARGRGAAVLPDAVPPQAGREAGDLDAVGHDDVWTGASQPRP
jgi:hypothetical protein